MTSILADFHDRRNSGNAIVIMPISRLKIDNDPIYFDNFVFYPDNYFDLIKLRIAPHNRHELREFKSSVTGIKPNVFLDNATVAFSWNVEWLKFYRQNYDSDCKLIAELSEHAENFMDIVRLYKCRLDLPDTLPGKVGTWNDGHGFSGALLYDRDNQESYIIAGSVLTHINIKGIGLELDLEDQQIQSLGNGETGRIAQRALALRTNALEANNLTSKYFQSIGLFEFLAYPDEYKEFKKVKQMICRHAANDNRDYLRLLNRFNVLGNKGDGTEKGYREKIVHQGKRLEEILPDANDIERLFDEIDFYLRAVIFDMVEYSDRSWSDFLTFRESLKHKLGLN